MSLVANGLERAALLSFLMLVGASSTAAAQQSQDTSATYVPDRVISNFSAGVSGESFDVTLWIKNAFDEDAPDFAQIFQSDLNSFRPVASIVGIPRRRIGLTARFRF
jgi:outer membrane receptor protein involved in Fe transport